MNEPNDPNDAIDPLDKFRADRRDLDPDRDARIRNRVADATGAFSEGRVEPIERRSRDSEFASLETVPDSPVRRRSSLFVAIAAAVALLAVGLAFSRGLKGADDTRTGTPPTQVAPITRFEELAERAATRPTAILGPGQFQYVRRELGHSTVIVNVGNDTSVTGLVVIQEEAWVNLTGTERIRRREDFIPADKAPSWFPKQEDQTFEPGTEPPGSRWRVDSVLNLPRDDAELEQALLDRARGDEVQLVSSIEGVLTFDYTPSETRVRLYRLLYDIGHQPIGTAKDHSGREGIGFSAQAGPGETITMVFDPETTEPLGTFMSSEIGDSWTVNHEHRIVNSIDATS